MRELGSSQQERWKSGIEEVGDRGVGSQRSGKEEGGKGDREGRENGLEE